MRYRFYREHKYLIFLLFELERLIAKADFNSNEQILNIKGHLNAYTTLLKAHAKHEENAIHALLKAKNSKVHENVEKNHKVHEKQGEALEQKLNHLLSTEKEGKLSLGYDFYLAYRLFLIDNLQHFHDEETIILRELHRLYSDDELKTVERNTYSHMTPEEMIHMLEVLCPHMDSNDKAFFLNDIKEATPSKYKIVAEVVNE